MFTDPFVYLFLALFVLNDVIVTITTPSKKQVKAIIFRYASLILTFALLISITCVGYNTLDGKVIKPLYIAASDSASSSGYMVLIVSAIFYTTWYFVITIILEGALEFRLNNLTIVDKTITSPSLARSIVLFIFTGIFVFFCVFACIGIEVGSKEFADIDFSSFDLEVLTNYAQLTTVFSILVIAYLAFNIVYKCMFKSKQTQ